MMKDDAFIKLITEVVDAKICASRAKTINDIDASEVRTNKKIDDQEKKTRISRWAEAHPGKAIIILIILFMLSAFAFHMIDIKGTIEKRFNIELKE